MGVPSRLGIQTYNLFGEDGDLPDVVHCETIAARSMLHDWAFTAHRHTRLHQILLIEEGGGTARLEDRDHPLGPMCAVNVPVGLVHGFSFTPGTIGWVVTLTQEILDEMLARSEGLRRVLGRAATVPATREMCAAMHDIFAEFAGRGFARAQILRSLTGVLAGLVARQLTASDVAHDSVGAGALFRRFEDLLESHFLEHWGVSDYAEALAVTPTHLSRVCRGVSGQPASRVILERVVREARRNLVYTNLTISAISYALGYDDPAYFSRVFASATGLSPRAFRDRMAPSVS